MKCKCTGLAHHKFVFPIFRVLPTFLSSAAHCQFGCCLLCYLFVKFTRNYKTEVVANAAIVTLICNWIWGYSIFALVKQQGKWSWHSFRLHNTVFLLWCWKMKTLFCQKYVPFTLTVFCAMTISMAKITSEHPVNECLFIYSTVASYNKKLELLTRTFMSRTSIPQ